MRKIEHKIVDGIELKRCCRCKEWQGLECFVKNKAAWDGLDGRCRNCKKQYNIDNHDKIKQYRIENVSKRYDRRIR